MSAPRWEDARDHALKLLREERTSLVAELPRIESVDERELFDAWVARVDLALATIGRIDDAALARLAEPAHGLVEAARALAAARDRCARVQWDADGMAVSEAEHIAAWDAEEVAAHAVMLAVNAIPRAEPARAPTAAERWRAVPEHAREAMIAELETSAAELDTAFGVNSAGKPWADHAAATRALLALAREAERSGA